MARLRTQRERTPLSIAQALGQAFALHRQGRMREAEALCKAVLAIDRNQFNALNILGLSLLSMGQLTEGARILKRAVKSAPKSAEAHNNLGYAFLLQGRHQKTVSCCRRALAINPEFAGAYSNLGTALMWLRRPEDARANFEKAASLQPNFAGAHHNLGSCYHILGRIEDAIASFQRAVSMDPMHVEAINNLGVSLHMVNRYEEAIRQFEQAIVVNPNFAGAHGNLAEVLEVLGRFPEAVRALERAIELDPKNPRPYRSLFAIKSVGPGDPHLHALESVAREAGKLPHEDQIHLHFALGKACADLGQHDRSFHHLGLANALKRQITAYDEPSALGEIDRIRTAFTPELMSAKQGAGEQSQLPVFVVGMPRSGTTLIEQILASHPRVFGAGELEDLNKAVAKLRGESGALFPEVVSEMTGEELRRFGAQYLEGIRALAPTSDRIIDKMPVNFRYVGLIHIALPGARIIHVRRDPVDTCISCFSKLFMGNLPYMYDLGELGRYYRAYEALMEHWRRVLPDGVMVEVQYEEVVADIEQQARRIVALCGLEWDDSCLSFHKTERPVRTASAAQVRQPIYRSSIGRWQRHRQHLGPLLDALGNVGTQG